MAKLPALRALSVQQRRFIKLLLHETADPFKAAEAAGYAAPDVSVQDLMRDPAIVAAIEFELARVVQGELAPKAFRVIKKILDDVGGTIYGARVVADTALKVAAMAGFGGSGRSIRKTDDERGVDQLSTEELRRLVSRLDDELAGRAKDVTPRCEPMAEDLADLL